MTLETQAMYVVNLTLLYVLVLIPLLLLLCDLQLYVLILFFFASRLLLFFFFGGARAARKLSRHTNAELHRPVSRELARRPKKNLGVLLTPPLTYITTKQRKPLADANGGYKRRLQTAVTNGSCVVFETEMKPK